MHDSLNPNIVFRRIDKPRYREWKRGEHFFVEAYFRLFSAPVAMAFVTVKRLSGHVDRPQLDFVFVP